MVQCINAAAASPKRGRRLISLFVSYDSEELANTLSYKLAPCKKDS
ncbi:hypothetical protein (plasmid) [Metabacillus dongyingensis]|nr:hypothetical protein [Metabacillus dongyingensis]